MATHRKSVHTRARSTAVLEAMEDGAQTIISLTKLLQIKSHLVHYTIRSLKKDGLIHITHWERPPHSSGDELYVAAFAAGPGEDAREPKRGGLDFSSTAHLQLFYTYWAATREPEEIPE